MTAIAKKSIQVSPAISSSPPYGLPNAICLPSGDQAGTSSSQI